MTSGRRRNATSGRRRVPTSARRRRVYWEQNCTYNNYRFCIVYLWLPSVLWHCWLGGRKGIRPVKTEWWGSGQPGVVVSLEHGADLHMAQLMPLPVTVSCFSKIQIGFISLVPAHLGNPGKGPLNGCACVNVYHLPINVHTSQPFLNLGMIYVMTGMIHWRVSCGRWNYVWQFSIK